MPHRQGGLTSQEIINLLNSDLEFGINFIIDNNPSAIESNISSLSIPLPQNPSNLQMREVIDSIMQDGQDDDAVEKIREILNVPYIDNATNYTAGFGTYLNHQQSARQDEDGENGDDENGGGWTESMSLAVIGAISGILGAVGNVWTAYKQEDMLEIQQQMQQDQIAFELDKIERTKILGIPQAVFIAVIVFVMFVVLIIFLSNRK